MLAEFSARACFFAAEQAIAKSRITICPPFQTHSGVLQKEIVYNGKDSFVVNVQPTSGKWININSNSGVPQEGRIH
jgi:hypothetical protein